MINKIRGVLSLYSIQSTPVTVTTLLLGYSSVSGNIITKDILYLILVGAIGHWAFYGLNDIIDYSRDERQRRMYKPLVGGDLTLLDSVFAVGAALILSVVYLPLEFPTLAYIFWILAAILGGYYNYVSKRSTYSAVYMGLWGASIIFTGSFYAGVANLTSLVLALLIGVHMVWMTVMGDLKDIENDEKSIAERLDCRVENENGYRYLWTSARFTGLAMAMVDIQILLMVILPVSDGFHRFDVLYVYIGALGALGILFTYGSVMYQPGFSRDKMQRDIAVHEVVSVLTVIVVSLSFINIPSVLVLILGTIVWGLFWQTVLYGHPLRFP